MGKNKESQIIINVENDCLLWKIDTDKEKNNDNAAFLKEQLL